MSQQVLLVHPPAPVREPRGAALAVSLVSFASAAWRGLAAAGRAVLRAMEAEGMRRAEREMRARGLSLATLEAARVRALADRWAQADPGFAADLRAAASRHEAEQEAKAGAQPGA